MRANMIDSLNPVEEIDVTRMARGNSQDGFTRVTVTVLRPLEKSVILFGPDGNDVVCGRSLLSHISESEIDSTHEFPVELELEIRSWLVKKEGLA